MCYTIFEVICMNVGEKIVKTRKEKGFSQIELAKKCNILYQTLGKYERGLLNPKLETIKKIAKALEIPYTQLIDDESSNEAYSFSHSQKLIDLYTNGVEAWINNEHLSIEQSRVLHEHYADLLARYKLLINHTVDTIFMSNDDKKKKIDRYMLDNPHLTEDEAYILFYSNYLKDDLKDIIGWINALPMKFHYATKEDSKQKKNEENK